MIDILFSCGLTMIKANGTRYHVSVIISSHNCTARAGNVYCTVKYLLATTAQYVQDCMCITLQPDKNWSLLYIMCTCAEIMCVLHMKWSTVYYMCSLVQMQA